jgi:hypothetical protein
LKWPRNPLFLNDVSDWFQRASLWPNPSGDFRAFPGEPGYAPESQCRIHSGLESTARFRPARAALLSGLLGCSARPMTEQVAAIRQLQWTSGGSGTAARRIASGRGLRARQRKFAAAAQEDRGRRMILCRRIERHVRPKPQTFLPNNLFLDAFTANIHSARGAGRNRVNWPLSAVQHAMVRGCPAGPARTPPRYPAPLYEDIYKESRLCISLVASPGQDALRRVVKGQSPSEPDPGWPRRAPLPQSLIL